MGVTKPETIAGSRAFETSETLSLKQFTQETEDKA
jgi:hypothetical protein